ncbi:MAG: competence/damage-inducible protein A, partial [Phycisphaerales bacterium]|nr:competence/damage-inducible protein A [Phycisphaerales bacterium]
MRARVLSIGDELLDGSSADTNSSWIAARLVEHGIQVLGIQVVPDVVEDIVDAMSVSVSDADLLIVTGGLGPTPDDVTREAMAVAMGCELVQNPEATSWVAQCLRERGLEPTEGQLSMGCCPAAAAWAPNSAGTAPILHGAVEEAHVWILPGPPREMRMGWHEQVAPSLHVDAASRLWHGHVYSHGLIEAEAADRLGELLDRTNDTVLGTRMSHGIFIVSITAAEERAGRVVQEEV